MHDYLILEVLSNLLELYTAKIFKRKQLSLLLFTDHTFRPNFGSFWFAKNIHLAGKYSLSVANFIFSLIFRLIGEIKSHNGPVMSWIYHYQYLEVMNSNLCDLSFQEICPFRKLPGSSAIFCGLRVNDSRQSH